ncbi:MAG: hypothetical protein Q4E21_03695 [Clostridia bacterium]|nr:hypothetical protein [Clostridia bacterium]
MPENMTNTSKTAYRAKLNIRFYLFTAFFAGLSAIGWYGIYFLNTNTIRMEDNTPMSDDMKLVFTVLLSVVILSWTVSVFVLLRQMLRGQAFYMDKDGIHNTITGISIFALLFYVPIKEIPYSAVQSIEEQDGKIIAILDKSQIITPFVFRPLVPKKYTFCNGFTNVAIQDIQSFLPRQTHMQQSESE